MIGDWLGLEANKKKFILAVVMSISLIYFIILYFAVSSLFTNKVDAERHHQIRMSPIGVEPGLTAPETLPIEGDFTTVKVGTYIDNIDGFAIKDSTWSANFYVWFNWTGQSNLDPGGKLVIVDGTIGKKDLLEDYHSNDGINYQKYRISAKFVKFYDTMRVPIESHMLNIYIEDGYRDCTKLRYVADTTSNISSRVKIPSYKIVSTSNTVKPHSYRTPYGDPRISSANSVKTYSQYIVGIQIKRSSFGLYVKIFISLFAALTLTLSNFFVNPSDVSPRFSLPSAAFFGAVANSYIANSILPTSDSFGLVDYVAAFGMGTIFLTIALALLSNNIYVKRNDKKMAIVLDRIMFITVGVCCLTANIAIPLYAFG